MRFSGAGFGGRGPLHTNLVQSDEQRKGLVLCQSADSNSCVSVDLLALFTIRHIWMSGRGVTEKCQGVNLFVLYFFKVWKTEEELSVRCVCLTQNLCCHTHTTQKFLLILGYPFWRRNSGGDAARINSNSIVSLEMKLRLCLLSDPECSCSLQPTGLNPVLSFFSQSDRAFWKALVTPLLARLANSGTVQNLLSCANSDDNFSKKHPCAEDRFSKSTRSQTITSTMPTGQY